MAAARALVAAAAARAADASVREDDAVGAAQQTGEHGWRPGERRLGVDDPAPLHDGCKVTQQRTPVDEPGHAAEERELTGIVEADEEQAAQ